MNDDAIDDPKISESEKFLKFKIKRRGYILIFHFTSTLSGGNTSIALCRRGDAL